VLRQRLILGPVLIAGIILGTYLDELIDRTRIPSWLSWLPTDSETLPPGVVAFLVCVALCLLGTVELARILRDKGIGVSMRVMSFAGVCGLVVQALVPSWTDGLSGSAVTSAAATIVLMRWPSIHVTGRWRAWWARRGGRCWRTSTLG